MFGEGGRGFLYHRYINKLTFEYYCIKMFINMGWGEGWGMGKRWEREGRFWDFCTTDM